MDPCTCSWNARPTLGPHLGPVVMQLPPTRAKDEDGLDRTLRAFPAHVRVAVEFRHPSWFVDRVCDILHRHNASLVWADRGGRLQNPDWITADWLYLRLHGGRGTAGNYGQRVIDAYAQRLFEPRPRCLCLLQQRHERQRRSERAAPSMRDCDRLLREGEIWYSGLYAFQQLIHQTHTRRTAMRIACLLDSDFEDSEFRKPYDAFKAAGHEVVIIGLQRDAKLTGKQGKEVVRAERGHRRGEAR